MRQATSIGLKINLDKLKLLPVNFLESELPAQPDGLPVLEDELYVSETTLLGFGFGRTPVPKPRILPDKSIFEYRVCFGPLKINANLAAENLKQRLRGCNAIITTARKTIKDPEKRLQIATSLIWTCCYDIGLIFAFVTPATFGEIEISIKKAVKLAGLDQLTDSDAVYKLSTKMYPADMAIKQIIQLGVKMLSDDMISSRFLLKKRENDRYMPFTKNFVEEFNNLPLKIREMVLNEYPNFTKKFLKKFKKQLKNHFSNRLMGEISMTKTQRKKLLRKNLYCRKVVLLRKRLAVQEKRKRDTTTPVALRSRLSSRSNQKRLKISLLRAPIAKRKFSLSTFPENTLIQEQPSKKAKTMVNTMDTPLKRAPKKKVQRRRSCEMNPD